MRGVSFVRKITQEVRGFAAKQNQGVEGFIASGPTGPTGAETAAAIKGMEEMSKLYDESGRELYMGAGGREHD